PTASSVAATPKQSGLAVVANRSIGAPVGMPSASPASSRQGLMHLLLTNRLSMPTVPVSVSLNVKSMSSSSGCGINSASMVVRVQLLPSATSVCVMSARLYLTSSWRIEAATVLVAAVSPSNWNQNTWFQL